MAQHKDTEAGTTSPSATPEVANVPTTEQYESMLRETGATYGWKDGALLFTLAPPPPFNPFTALDGAELTALASSYNKQWRQVHALTIAMAMSEFNCSENEAIFYASLKVDAASIIDRDSVNDTVSSITGLLRGVAFPKQSEVSLAMIEGHYSELKTGLRKTAGIRIRDFAHKEWEQTTADNIMSKVYKHLGIAEKDWMR